MGKVRVCLSEGTSLPPRFEHLSARNTHRAVMGQDWEKVLEEETASLQRN